MRKWTWWKDSMLMPLLKEMCLNAGLEERASQCLLFIWQKSYALTGQCLLQHRYMMICIWTRSYFETFLEETWNFHKLGTQSVYPHYPQRRQCSTRPFREGFSNMILFSLQHGTLRSYVTYHTTMVARRNKLRSIQLLRMRPKWRLRLKILSLHFLVSFRWRNVHWFVFRGRIHNRHKIGQHNMIATKFLFIFSNKFSNQILGMHLKRFIFTFKIINKFVRQNKFSTQVHIPTFKLF